MITKEMLESTLDDLSQMIYLKNYKQLTIDIIDELIPNEINNPDLIVPWQTILGSISYHLSILLEVMDKTLPDYILLNRLYKIINE